MTRRLVEDSVSYVDRVLPGDSTAGPAIRIECRYSPLGSIFPHGLTSQSYPHDAKLSAVRRAKNKLLAKLAGAGGSGWDKGQEERLWECTYSLLERLDCPPILNSPDTSKKQEYIEKLFSKLLEDENIVRLTREIWKNNVCDPFPLFEEVPYSFMSKTLSMIWNLGGGESKLKRELDELVDRIAERIAASVNGDSHTGLLEVDARGIRCLVMCAERWQYKLFTAMFSGRWGGDRSRFLGTRIESLARAVERAMADFLISVKRDQNGLLERAARRTSARVVLVDLLGVNVRVDYEYGLRGRRPWIKFKTLRVEDAVVIVREGRNHNVLNVPLRVDLGYIKLGGPSFTTVIRPHI